MPRFLKHSTFYPLIFISFASLAQTRPFIADSIQSKILGETRQIRIIVPESYKTDSTSRYEVLYVCDGEWYDELVPDTYNFAESAGYVPKSIFVFMRNRYLRGINLRDRDFSPINTGDSLSGGADKFYDFVTTEVVPYIEQRYRVDGQRSILGSSFSGLFAVYAFVKEPGFFQSYIASDPSIIYGDAFVTKLAAKKLPAMKNAGSLFIAALTNTAKWTGSYGFDSVLRANAGKELKWKTIFYDNESHYSVQLKAFYDGFRFSHYGYATGKPEVHPGNGMVAKGRMFTMFSQNRNPGAHFTTDGSQPDANSPVLNGDTSIVITPPQKIWIKTFGTRASYSKDWTIEYTQGFISPTSRKKTVTIPLTYALYEGRWDSFPSVDTLKAIAGGKADSTFRLSQKMFTDSGYAVVNGEIEVKADQEYIFYVNGYDAAELTVGLKTIIDEKLPGGSPSASFIVSLKKGIYPLQLRLLHKTPTLQPHFAVFKCNGRDDKWYQNVVMSF